MRRLLPNTEVRIDAPCLDCGEPIVVRMQDEKILEVDAPRTVGHMNVPLSRLLRGVASSGYA